MTAPYGSNERPGGWVEGIGWVAKVQDLAREDRVSGPQQSERPARIERNHYPWSVVLVLRWADGTVPSPPSPVEDGRPDTAEMRFSAQTVEVVMNNGQGDDAAALLIEAADWIDARPSAGTGDNGSGT